MFGTIAKMKFKPGMMQKLLEDMKEEFSNGDDGSVAVYTFQMTADPNVGYMVAISESEQAYRDNANKPETHERFTKMMEYLVEEPEWNDGYVIYSQTTE